MRLETDAGTTAGQERRKYWFPVRFLSSSAATLAVALLCADASDPSSSSGSTTRMKRVANARGYFADAKAEQHKAHRLTIKGRKIWLTGRVRDAYQRG